MATIHISNLQPIDTKLEQLSYLDTETIVGGLSTVGCSGGVDFVPIKDDGTTVILKPVFIPCNPKPSDR